MSYCVGEDDGHMIEINALKENPIGIYKGDHNYIYLEIISDFVQSNSIFLLYFLSCSRKYLSASFEDVSYPMIQVMVKTTVRQGKPNMGPPKGALIDDFPDPDRILGPDVANCQIGRFWRASKTPYQALKHCLQSWLFYAAACIYAMLLKTNWLQ